MSAATAEPMGCPTDLPFVRAGQMAIMMLYETLVAVQSPLPDEALRKAWLIKQRSTQKASIGVEKGVVHMSHADHEIFELRQRVAKLERQIAFLLERLSLETPEEPDQGVSPEIIDLVRRGKKIQAIKLFRQETGAGLRDAKEFIDSLEG